MKKRLIHVMMGTHNPDLQRGLDSVFDATHLDWLRYHKDKNYAQLQHDIVDLSSRLNPDVIFMHVQSGDVISIDTLKKLNKKSILINWTGDVRYPLPSHYIETGRHVDCTLFTNMNDVYTAKENGISAGFLQVGFDSQYFTPLGRVNPKYPEIIFLGGNYPNSGFPLSQYRLDMVRCLLKEFPGKFMVYGGGWTSLGVSHNHIGTYEEEGVAYRSCKIAINLSHFDYSRYSSDRMYRILGSGAFCLSHDYSDIGTDFKVGRDLDTWINHQDLINKIKYYLLNDAKRESIAMAGCYVAHTSYTWHHFSRNLMDIVQSIKK